MKENLIESLRGVYGTQYSNAQYAAYAQYIIDHPECIENGTNMMDFVEGGEHG